MSVPIALTPGEPAGIGPDLTLMLAQSPRSVPLVAVADPDILATRARALGLTLEIERWEPGLEATRAAGRLAVRPVRAAAAAVPGRLDPRNGGYVLDTLNVACDGCGERLFGAMVTGPVHKALINEAGHAFTGHTEYLARRSGATQPVMLMAAPGLRVALATTHLPLMQVSAVLTAARLEQVLDVVWTDLRRWFGVPAPRILVCGLNPHAGEDGHLGREEIDIMRPVLDELRSRGLDLTGPVPADTAFTPQRLAQTDVVVTLYHDQGLPLVKHRYFDSAVNVTLGLPFLRTSVDHGTALELAGTGRARPQSLRAAIGLAADLLGRAQGRGPAPATAAY